MFLQTSNFVVSTDGFNRFKRDPWLVMPTLLSTMILGKDDFARISSNFVLTHRLYQRLLEQLKRDPEKLIKTVNDFWSRIVTPNNTKVYLAADTKLMVKMLITRH